MTEPGYRETGDIALRTEGLTKAFGEFRAVDGVDLSIERGEFRSVIGPNGAGKTTLFNLISGALTPSSGTISLLGTDITAQSPAERVESGLARSFQLTTVFDGLSVRENVRLAAQAAEFGDLSTAQQLFVGTESLAAVDQRTDSVLDSVGLADLADAQASTLAYGDRRRLELGLVLATDPEVVLLDEPTAGMSGEETAATIDLVEDVLAEKTLVLVEHDVDLVMRISDRITVLNGGQSIATGTPGEIADNDEVQRAYLGGYDA
ncbi:ABC transporter ATP-binding protein [Haloarcula marina]|uniref:ABC transporter ATP-binding protein n=1 Tax=Haloarcula marina TaxID=2961574 RepID=UPI0020B8BCC0|nr:ABC transporter ATP-binding protein [Halomicroarcula marina]